MNILLVDDSRTMRSIQKKTLETLGQVTFAEAGDGIEALSLLAATPEGFNLALIDWNMPNMDGLTLVRKIREKNKALPLVMVTTEAEKQRIIDALRAGANNYILKPFTPETLLEKIKQTLDRVKTAVAKAA
jgi:two-component system, chemotaxis family, chemotaxis protein CheY